MAGRSSVTRHDRVSRGGGVLILVRENLSCCSLEPILPRDIELAGVDIIVDSNIIRCVCVYSSPTGTAEELVSRMQDLCCTLEALYKPDSPFYLVGDFNLPKIDWGKWSCPEALVVTREATFLDFCSSMGLSQMVTEPTRPRSQNILDLVFCADDTVHVDGVFNSPISSDHSLILFSITLAQRCVTADLPLEHYDYSAADYDWISHNLSLTDWETFFLSCPNIDQMYHRLVDYLLFLRTMFVPRRAINCTKNISGYIRRLHRKIINETDPEALKRLQTDLNRASNRQRTMLENDIARSSNKKRFFGYVASRTNSKDHLSALLDPQGKLETDDLAKAELLRNHFAKQYPTTDQLALRNQGPGPVSTVPQDLRTVDDVDASPYNIFVHLKKLNNSSSRTPDDIPATFLKGCGYDICTPLSLIFKRSLDEGVIPQIFKTAIVVPLHKRGDKTRVENKRNVSLTSAVCKIYESIISDAIFENARTQNLLNAEQYAYRKGYSCTLQLLMCQNDFAAYVNGGDSFDVVYFDFKSAFELTTHSKLIKCYEAIGTGPRLCRWIKAFLSGRTFRVSVNEQVSQPAPVTSGCPQGTLLGCLSYVVYTNSIMGVFPPEINVKQYADDVKIYTKINCLEDSDLLQSAIDAFLRWTASVDLELTTSKCKVVHFGRTNPRFVYTLNGNLLQSVKSIRDLGVTVSSDLKSSDHTREVVQRASRCSNLILRSFVLQDINVYVSLFKTYVIPIITYASPVWRPSMAKDRRLLQTVYNRFRRLAAYRCGIQVALVPVIELEDIFDQCDIAAFRSIAADDYFCSRMFDKIDSRTRSLCNHRPKFTAKSELVNNFFAWRVVRLLLDPSRNPLSS